MEVKLAAPARLQPFFETVRQPLRATEPDFGEPRPIFASGQLLGINQVALMRIVTMPALVLGLGLSRAHEMACGY